MIRYFNQIEELRDVTVEDDYKLVTNLKKLNKNIKEMKLGKRYTVITEPDKKRNKKISGNLTYKDKDIFIIQTDNYLESFRVLDLFDKTIEVLEQ